MVYEALRAGRTVELSMALKPHPDYGALLGAMKIAVARLRPWSGVIYRSAPPKWSAGREMLTGVGSMKSGARFNATGSFAAVYGSTTPELAMIESLGEESLSQAVGRAAHSCRAQAIQVASAHTSDHGFNIVVLPDHTRPPSRFKVLRRPIK